MVLTVLFSAGFVLLLHGVTPAIAETCAANRYSSSGTLRGVVYSDCTSGKRLAKSRFWLDGELRSFDERSNAVRFRENRNRDGSLRSLRVWEPNGLDINFSRRRIRFDGTGDSRAVSTVEGLRIFSTGETYTLYGSTGVPELRVDRAAKELSIPEAALPSPRRDSFGLAFEANYQRHVLAGDAADGVFLGDSIVSHLNGLNDPDKRLVWGSLTGDHFFMNGAVAGDRVRNLLARTWAIEPTARLVAIQIGTNDHDPNFPDADPFATAEAIARLAAEAQSIAKDATIVLISIPPTTGLGRHEKNQVTNQLIEALAEGDRILFVGGGAEFDPADPQHSSDGLHQTYAGALAWYGPLAPVFREILEQGS